MKMFVDRSRFFKWSDFVHKSPGSKLSTLLTTFIKGLLRPFRLAFIYLILCLAVQVSAQTDMTGSKSPPERNSYSAPIYSTSRCNKSCTSQEDVPCTIRVLHSYCMMTRKEHADFPNKPRELNISHNVVNNRRVFNITWKAPYDYSYRVLEGFELLLDKKSHNIFSGMPECIFFNLSTVNWTAVTNIHSVVFFYDCWQESIHTDMKIKLTLFSYPKPLEQAPYESKTLNVTAMAARMTLDLYVQESRGYTEQAMRYGKPIYTGA